jgi:hypothetical protein
MGKLAAGLAAVFTLMMLAGGLVLAGEARAQTYPPPVGSLSIEAGSTTTGGTSDVTATVLDESGNPVEGAEVVFRIVSQPGDDATWSDGSLEITALTDANGLATAVLTAGSDPGDIIIETISGAKTSQVTVAVAAAAGGLPPTGASPDSEGGDNGVATWQIVFVAIGAALLAGGIVVTARRNKRA